MSVTRHSILEHACAWLAPITTQICGLYSATAILSRVDAALPVLIIMHTQLDQPHHVLIHLFPYWPTWLDEASTLHKVDGMCSPEGSAPWL